MTVVGQLTPQEEEETQNDIDHYEWTAKLVRATCEYLLMIVSRIQTISVQNLQ